jgi:threonylcarbamoyladenosine tRNA methylthiotransferase MtaB
MRIAVHTLGCKLNYSETSRLCDDLLSHGHTIVPFDSEADAIILNTCSVTEQADVECRKLVRRGRRTSPDAAVIVTGCYAQLKPDEISAIDGVRAVIGTAHKFSIADRIESLVTADEVVVDADEIADDVLFQPSRTHRTASRTRTFFKIQDGCDYSCSFCTIPKARGNARSMMRDDVRREVARIVADGYREVILSGVNLGEYRDAEDTRFVDVLRMIDEDVPPFRLRISSIEPNTVTPELIDVVATSSSIVPHLHIPLQSGSAGVLRRMRRRYTVDYYRSLVNVLHERIPGLALGIDVIVGFPGETEQEFEETYAFLEDAQWSYLHVFTYSERDDTVAAAMEQQVDRGVRRMRTQRLRTLSEWKHARFIDVKIGSTARVLPESYDPLTQMWRGWSEHHVAVSFAGEPDQVKMIYSVRLTERIDQEARGIRIGDDE